MFLTYSVAFYICFALVAVVMCTFLVCRDLLCMDCFGVQCCVVIAFLMVNIVLHFFRVVLCCMICVAHLFCVQCDFFGVLVIYSGVMCICFFMQGCVVNLFDV